MKQALVASGLTLGCLALAVSCASDPVSRAQPDANSDAAPINLPNLPPPGDGGGALPTRPGEDPATCDEAAVSRTYLGCEFWPTVTYNPVDQTFDFAVVVSNPQTVDAAVTVTGGPFGDTYELAVKPGGTGRLALPWVPALKATTPGEAVGSVKVRRGAYRMVSSVPVVAYQFNPLQFKGGPDSWPAGKDWSACKIEAPYDSCYSFTNDASLLLPSTALTGNYRVYGGFSQSLYRRSGDGDAGPGRILGIAETFAAITATQPNTSVGIKLGNQARVTAGPGVPAAARGSTMNFVMDVGDVVLLSTTEFGTDLSGSLIAADKPVQVISGMQCAQFPFDTYACDHVEESLFPVETLGKHYFVAPPTSPLGASAGMMVRFHGNVDNTKLTYFPSKPPACPEVIQAGENLNCGDFSTAAGVVNIPFEVIGDHEFAVTTYQLGSQYVDTESPGVLGDPSQSQPVAVEQFRRNYTFLTPRDYVISVVDIVYPADAKLMLDGIPVDAALSAWDTIDGGNPLFAPTPISNGYVLRRVPLDNSKNDAHTLTGDKPFGIQVMGYGAYTSYQYPGGLNLGVIADVPVK